MDHATKDKDGKWYAPPPVVPIGLRSTIKLDEIIVTAISTRERFGAGYGANPVEDEFSSYILLGDSYDRLTRTPTGETHLVKEDDNWVSRPKFVRDPKAVARVDRIINAYGLEKSEDFLRSDRHVIGKSRDFNYSVISSFKPKKYLKLCGFNIPQGTEIHLSVRGPGREPYVRNVIPEGVLYVLGIPNEKRLQLENEPPSKTISCVPRAIASNYETLAEPLWKNPDAPLPPLPKVDYSDCECIAKDPEIDEIK